MDAKLRGKRYWIHGTVAGRFLRLPLGTANKDAARVTVDHVERALSEGQTSLRWPELTSLLPPRTFAAIASVANYREPEPEAPAATWSDLETAFKTEMQQCILLGKLAESTNIRYEQ